MKNVMLVVLLTPLAVATIAVTLVLGVVSWAINVLENSGLIDIETETET